MIAAWRCNAAFAPADRRKTSNRSDGKRVYKARRYISRSAYGHTLVQVSHNALCTVEVSLCHHREPTRTNVHLHEFLFNPTERVGNGKEASSRRLGMHRLRLQTRD